jgi:outer membrane protein assembly complex protein YaeT
VRQRCHAAAIAALLVAGASASACRDEGDVRVASLTFEGNKAFSNGQLAAVVATKASGRLPWSQKRYFTRHVFDADLERLRGFYTDRGYPAVRVTSVGVEFTEKKDAVRLRIAIDEGAPLLVEDIKFEGLEGVPKAVTDRLDSLPLKRGAPRDRQLVAASRERLAFILRDTGYAYAAVTSQEASTAQANRVVVTFQATPGPASTFGPVTIENLKSVHQSLVLRTVTFKPGDQYRESRVLESQRRLNGLGIFDFAHLAPVPAPEGSPPPPVVPMKATLAEGKPQRLQLGVGWGTEDGPRGSLQWDHLNFMGDGRHASLDTRYSLRLRGAGIEFLEPYFLSTRFSFSAKAGAWWTDETTYDSRSIGGRLALTFAQLKRGIDRQRLEHVVRFSYVNESLTYTITPEALGDPTQFDELIALGLNPITGVGSGRRAALEFDVQRTALDRLSDPHRGHGASLHLVYATPGLGGTFRYREISSEGHVYVPLGPRHVWASYARAGVIVANSPDNLPFSQRYYLGGSTTLRGWGRYQVAPLTEDGLPIGGRALLQFSTELRVAVRGSLGAVLFVDTGNVWDETTRVRLRDLLADIGPGLRWTSPVGVIRGDVGFQLRHLPGLVINGEPEKRQWRVHFSIGHAF